jgi:polygalacturonase
VAAVAGTGGTLQVPDGTYRIEAVHTWDGGAGGVALGSRMTLRMSAGAVLKAIPNSRTAYSIVAAFNVTDVAIIGGTILGERAQHNGSTGEWGMGIDVRGGRNIVIDSVTTKENWGDGVYLDGSTDGAKATNITLCAVTADHNRRQGLSIVKASAVTVRDSVFKNTQGTAPQCGIDIEPDPGKSVDNVKILNSAFPDNASCGIKLYAGGPITNVTIDGDTVSGPAGRGIGLGGTSGQRVTNNTIQSYYGIDLLRSSAPSAPTGPTGNLVTGNRICAHVAIIRDGFQNVTADFNGNTVRDNTTPAGCTP